MRIDDSGLICYRCICGHASAWSWEDGAATLVYGGKEPEPLDDALDE